MIERILSLISESKPVNDVFLANAGVPVIPANWGVRSFTIINLTYGKTNIADIWKWNVIKFGTVFGA